jgi:hypothetical protein
MRGHGVEIQAPSTGSGNIQVKSANMQTAAFQKAQHACQGLIPKPTGGTPPGAVGG